MSVEFDIRPLPEDATAADRASWEAYVPARQRELVEHCFRELHLSKSVELSIAVVDEDEMSELHVQWMELPGPTDVLSFPMDELRAGTVTEPSLGVLGDIVLCPPVAQRQAEAAGHSTQDELCLLTVHGMLHLLGHDHVEDTEREAMFTLQRDLLEEFLGHEAPVETMK